MIRVLALVMAIASAAAVEVGSWGFETPAELAAWRGISGANIALVAEGDGHVLAITPGDHRHSVQAICELPLAPEWRRLAVGLRMRASGVVLGQEHWQDVRLSLEFRAGDGRLVGYGQAPCLRSDSGWVRCASEMEIPAAAATVHLIAANFTGGGASAFDDIRVSADPHLALAAGPFQADFTANADGWFLSSNQQRIVADVLELDAAHGPTEARTLLAVDPGWKRVRIVCRLRAQGLVVGATPSATARIDVDRLNAEGRPIGLHHPVISLARDTDWHEQSIDLDLPPGTRCLILRPRNAASAGILSISDLRCSPLD